MATSTQRLMLIILVLNLVIGLAGAIYKQETYTDEILTPDEEIAQAMGENIINPANLGGGFSNDIYGGSVGNPFQWGRGLWNIFWYGVTPFPFITAMFSTTTEAAIASGLLLFRLWSYVIIGLEFFLIMKNKKST